MSIHRISKDFFEVFSMLTHPSQSFSSGSLGVTGSMPIMAMPMSGVKVSDNIAFLKTFDVWGSPYTEFVDVSADDELGTVSTDIRAAMFSDVAEDKSEFFEAYLGAVTSYPSLQSQYIQFPVTRSFPRYHLTKELKKLNVIKDVLIPHYRQNYTNCDYSYINYHSLNFFTGVFDHRNGSNRTAFPTGSVLIYPNMTSTYAHPNPTGRSFQEGATRLNALGEIIDSPGPGDPPYIPQAGFTFEFYINPKYTTDDPVQHVLIERDAGSHFRPGTIMHVSSTYAISLMTGSSTDRYGHPNGYRLLLQLTNSADIPPACFGLTEFNAAGEEGQFLKASEYLKLADGGLYKHDTNDNFAFISSDNGLSRNNWHHVAVRWGTKDLNEGTGSIVIDGKIDSYFHTASLSSMNSIASPVQYTEKHWTDDPGSVVRVISGSDPDALFIGNFYEGSNTFSENTEILRFFNTVSGTHCGFSASIGPGRINPWDGSKEDPVAYLKNDPIEFNFRHPLNAEIHDIRIYDGYRTLEQIGLDKERGPADFKNLLAYIPPLFLERPRHRSHILRGPHFGAAARAGSFTDVRTAVYMAGGSKTNRPPLLGGIRMSSGTDTPFNTLLGYQNGALSISLENFTCELVRNRYPRLERLFEANLPGKGYTEEGLSTSTQKGAGDLPTGDLQKLSADDLYHLSPDNTKRNLTILPCDNGMFAPDYTLILTGTQILEGAASLDHRWLWGPPGGTPGDPTMWDLGYRFAEAFPDGYEIVWDVNTITFPQSMVTGSHERMTARMTNDLNIVNPMYISLRNYVDADTFINSIGPMSETLSAILDPYGTPRPAYKFPTPDLPGKIWDSTLYEPSYTSEIIRYLPIYAANRDVDSNQVSWFDISNLYYGNRILPGSFNIRDIDLTGSNGKIPMRLRDDARGGLYRSDCETPQATWNTVGNIFYDEGLVIVKSPHISRFGKSQYEMSFKGENPVHVFTVNVPCPAGQVNVSSNATFTEFAPTMNANEESDSFVYVTGIDMLDNNLNVIMRASLAQPMTKRTIDEFLFRLKMDF